MSLKVEPTAGASSRAAAHQKKRQKVEPSLLKIAICNNILCNDHRGTLSLLQQDRSQAEQAYSKAMDEIRRLEHRQYRIQSTISNSPSLESALMPALEEMQDHIKEQTSQKDYHSQRCIAIAKSINDLTRFITTTKAKLKAELNS